MGALTSLTVAEGTPLRRPTTVPFSVLCGPRDQAEGVEIGGCSMVCAEHRSALLPPDILPMSGRGGELKTSPGRKDRVSPEAPCGV